MVANRRVCMPYTIPAKPHILVVDDEASFREVVAATLTEVGYSVEIAWGGREAERLLRTECFDLIITDVIMPDGDGIEMIMNLHAANNVVPIIAMTGAHQFTELYLKTARALGACRVLTKPFKFAELLDTAREVLAEQAPPGSRT